MHKAKNICFLLIKKKNNEMAQGRRWREAGYVPLLYFIILKYQ